MDNDELHLMVDKLVNQLGEHFDSVQVFVQLTENHETDTYKSGCGSWHARIGMCHEMIEMNKARNFLVVKREEFDNNTEE